MKAKERSHEHPLMQVLKRRLKFGQKLTKQQCAEYVRKLLKNQR